MAIPTIPQTIQRGDISIYLSANNNSIGQLFGGRLSPISALTIAIVTDALRWGYNGGAQTTESLREVANYLIWITGRYGQQAEYILNGAGGGTVIPISPANPPARMDFYVTDSTTVSTGQTTVVISQYIGYGLDLYRNNIPQAIVTDGVSSYFTWDSTTGTLFIDGAAIEGELLSLIPYL